MIPTPISTAATAYADRPQIGRVTAVEIGFDAGDEEQAAAAEPDTAKRAAKRG